MNLIPIKENCEVNRVKDLDLNKFKPTRAGVIVYTVYKRKVYFIGGIDTKSGEFTDFGGGVSYKTDQNALTGGLRELSEESLGIFGTISLDEIQECVAVYDENNLITFIPFNINIKSKYYEFMDRLKFCKHPEVRDLTILDKKQFISLINGNNVGGTMMYTKVRDLLANGRKNNFMRYL